MALTAMNSVGGLIGISITAIRNSIFHFHQSFYDMSYKNLLQRRQSLGIPLLLWCLFAQLSPNSVQAQCNVFFTQCPTDTIVLIDCDNSGDEPISWPVPIASTSGGCENFSMVQTIGPAPGTLVPAPGIYKVAYVAGAYDILTGDPDKAKCAFLVQVVEDTEPPVFTFCPPDITLYTGNEFSVLGLWPEPIVTDNCDPSIIAKTKTPCKSKLAPGIHQIVYKAVDPSGNVAYCHFNVTVIQGFMKPGVDGGYVDVLEGVAARQKLDVGAEQPQIFLLPNPFNHKLVLNTDFIFDTDLQVQTFDLQGKLISASHWPTGSDQLIIPAESIKPGVVLVKVLSLDGTFTQVLRGVKL